MSPDSQRVSALRTPAPPTGRGPPPDPRRTLHRRLALRVVPRSQDRGRMDRRRNHRRQVGFDRHPVAPGDRKPRPSSACAAVAPRHTSPVGGTAAISKSSQCLHAVTSSALGFWWIRRLPRGRHLKCFTTLVRYTGSRSIPTRSSSSSRTRPAGPTKGWPSRSSTSPGCSPTSMGSASGGPSPKTVWVPVRHRSQALHRAARHAAGRGLHRQPGAVFPHVPRGSLGS